ncbi:MAG: hypothetical protein CMF19_10240, partial [Idiomarinaceae bacterium]|nr:hypothetical protein [Idiomarinaceae bacterium]
MLNIRQIKTTMIRLFGQLPLYVRFGLAFLLPVLVIAWVTASNILQLSTSVSQIDRLKSNLALTVDAGQLVGNLQDERGYSVLRLKTGASAFGQRLQQSQQRTDTVLAALEQRLDSTTSAHRQSAT